MKKVIFLLLFLPTLIFGQNGIDTAIIAESGGDYVSIAAFEAGEDRDLVSADTAIVGLIQGVWTDASDRAAVVIDGWTTDATRDIIIKVDTSTASFHTGTFDTSGDAHRFISTGICFDIREQYLIVDGLQLVTTSTSGSVYIGTLLNVNATPYAITFKNNFCIRDADVASGELFVGESAVGRFTFINNFMSGLHGNDAAAIRNFNAGCTTIAYNNTFHDCNIGYKTTIAPSVSRFYNNIFVAVDTCFKIASSASIGDNNATENAGWGTNYTAGSNDNLSQTFTFVDSANKDFHLTSTDAGAKNLGTDLSADSYYSFDYDYEGESRSGTWDIGFDEFTGEEAVETIIRWFNSVSNRFQKASPRKDYKNAP